MTDPLFLQITPELRGAIVNGPDGCRLVSVHHEPTGRALYGVEPDLAGALSWLANAPLIFAEAEGTA